MPRFLVERQFSVGEDQMPEVGRRSRRIVEEKFPEITWEHPGSTAMSLSTTAEA